MAIFVLLLAALGGLFASSTRAYSVNAERSEALQDAEAVVQLLRYELALAGYRGVGTDFDQAFTLDAGAAETVAIERGTDSDVITIRYFEDRYLGGGGDTGERRVSFSVDLDEGTLVRSELRSGGAEVSTGLLVGNVLDLRVLSLVAPDGSTVSVEDILVDETTVAPDRLAGLLLAVDFIDGRVWEFMVGLTNPQVFTVGSL